MRPMRGRPWWRRRLNGRTAAALGTAPLGLLSLGVAIVVWALVTNSENPVDMRGFDVRVEAVSVPRDLVAGGFTPEKVRVDVSGPNNLLRRVRGDEITAQVDLSGSGADNPGQNEFVVRPRVTVKRDRLDSRLDVRPQLDQVEVRLQRQESRRVPVKVTQVGVLPVGYELAGEITLDPPVRDAVVTGAPGNVSAVESVSADVAVDGASVSVSRPVSLDARDSGGRTIGGVTVSPATVNARLNVKQTLFEKQVSVLVQTRGRPKTGFTVTSLRSDPAFVGIVGTLDQINSTSAVLTEPVDLDGADQDLKRSIPLQLPGVTAKQQSVVVSVGLQVVRAPGSISAVPRVFNVAPGFIVAQTTPAVVALNVSGPLGDLAALRPTDAVVTIDAGGHGAGTYRLEPKVTLPPSIQLEATVPDRVEVVIVAGR